MAGMQPFAQLDASQVEHLEAALAALHASGGVHGQVNASHVFRDADGCVVLCVPAVCPLDAISLKL